MRAHDLIEHLKKLPPDTEVFIWLDGERLEISKSIPIDYWDEDKHADINVTIKFIDTMVNDDE